MDLGSWILGLTIGGCFQRPASSFSWLGWVTVGRASDPSPAQRAKTATGGCGRGSGCGCGQTRDARCSSRRGEESRRRGATIGLYTQGRKEGGEGVCETNWKDLEDGRKQLRSGQEGSTHKHTLAHTQGHKVRRRSRSRWSKGGRCFPSIHPGHPRPTYAHPQPIPSFLQWHDKHRWCAYTYRDNCSIPR